MKKKLFYIFGVVLCIISIFFYINQRQNESAVKADEYIQEEVEIAEQNGAVNKFHPIVFYFKSEKGSVDTAYLIGGYNEGTWYTKDKFEFTIDGKKPDINSLMGKEPAEAVLDLALGDEGYHTYGSEGYIGLVTGGKPLFTADGAGNEYFEIKTEAVQTDSNIVIGVNSGDAPDERIVKRDNGKVIADYDNDGTEEYIFSEEKTQENGEKEASIYIAKGDERILVTKTGIDGTYLADYDFIPVDLNNDKIMEIVLVKYGHNLSIHIFDTKSIENGAVIEEYWGD